MKAEATVAKTKNHPAGPKRFLFFSLILCVLMTIVICEHTNRSSIETIAELSVYVLIIYSIARASLKREIALIATGLLAFCIFGYRCYNIMHEREYEKDIISSSKEFLHYDYSSKGKDGENNFIKLAKDISYENNVKVNNFYNSLLPDNILNVYQPEMAGSIEFLHEVRSEIDKLKSERIPVSYKTKIFIEKIKEETKEKILSSDVPQSYQKALIDEMLQTENDPFEHIIKTSQLYDEWLIFTHTYVRFLIEKKSYYEIQDGVFVFNADSELEKYNAMMGTLEKFIQREENISRKRTDQLMEARDKIKDTYNETF